MLSAELEQQTMKKMKMNDMSNTAPVINVKLWSEKAKMPTRGSIHAAGYDLYSSGEVTIPARGRAVVPTDISISIPYGTYGRVAPRSGLAVKNGLDVGAGVIDADYRGKVGVVMFNMSDIDYNVVQGDRIAQLIIEKIEMCTCVQVEELGDTVRGSGGFGSSGMQ